MQYNYTTALTFDQQYFRLRAIFFNLVAVTGQNKFEVDILKNVAKIAYLRPKIGQIPLLSLNINGHNSVIFHPILTFFILNCFFVVETNRMV